MSDDFEIIVRIPRNATSELLVKTGTIGKQMLLMLDGIVTASQQRKALE